MVTEEMKQRVIRRIKKIVLSKKLRPAGIVLTCQDEMIEFLDKVEDLYYDRFRNQLRWKYGERFSLSYALLKYNSQRVLEVRDGQIDSTDRRLVFDA